MSQTYLSKKMRIAFILTALLSSAISVAYASQKPSDDAQILAKAKSIHKKVLTIDTHNDIDINNFVFSRNYTQDLENQVTLPKMIAGGLDASFFIVYTGQSSEPDAFEAAGYKRAYDSAIAMFEAIHRMTTVLAPSQIEFARTSYDVRRIYAKGKKVALIGVENAYPLGDEKDAIKNIKNFYDRGARYMSLAHQGHSQFSDSNSGEQTGWKWNGLSPLGVKAIAEMNRLGIMVDVSHPSKESMMQTLKITNAPIIASHSSIRSIANVSRNMDDEQLLALKTNNGVIQIVGLSGFIKTDSVERINALKELQSALNITESFNAIARGPVKSLTTAQRDEFLSRLAILNKDFPPSRANVHDFVDHIDYAVKKIGINHVGIASDFDGGGGIDGWNDASETLNVTTELVRRGYTEDQIAKLWGGNLLRVMSDVEKVSKSLQKLSK
jgi:membrane dipeptidase